MQYRAGAVSSVHSTPSKSFVALPHQSPLSALHNNHHPHPHHHPHNSSSPTSSTSSSRHNSPQHSLNKYPPNAPFHINLHPTVAATASASSSSSPSHPPPANALTKNASTSSVSSVVLHPHSFALNQQKQRSFLTFGFGAGGSGPSRRESHVNVNVTPTSHDASSDTPEIRKYKKRFNSEILCAALWGVNLLIGTENGLMLLDRSGQGKVNYFQIRRWLRLTERVLYVCVTRSIN